MALGDNELKGRDGQGTLTEEAHKALAGSVNPKYESKEFAIAADQTDHDVKVNVSGAFATVSRGHNFAIRTDEDVTVKFNAAGNDGITVLKTEGVFSWNHTEFENIFITTGPNGANVKLIWS